MAKSALMGNLLLLLLTLIHGAAHEHGSRNQQMGYISALGLCGGSRVSFYIYILFF